jgi:regulator of telomere elongation helicase 1
VCYRLELVVRHGPRCIILASGTLSPLPFLESELRTPFPVKLSNPHIISDSQLFACVLKNGPPPQCAKLSSTFQNRGNSDYLTGLGEVIRSVCSVVPKGVLVFFPSYTVMDSCVKFWEHSKMIDRINSLKVRSSHSVVVSCHIRK